MTFQTSALINLFFCIVARSRLTDVATTVCVEWERASSNGVMSTVSCSDATTDTIHYSGTKCWKQSVQLNIHLCFSKWKCQSREIQLHCITEMRKYEMYTHIHSYVHIFTDAYNTCADIHACFYTYGYGCTHAQTHTQHSIHSSMHVKLEVKLKFSLKQATKVRRGVSSTLF